MLNVFHLDEVKLDVSVEVFLPRDLGRLRALVGDEILLPELEFSYFLEFYCGHLVLGFEKLDVIFFAHQRDFAITIEDFLHFLICLSDKEVRFLEERPLLIVWALFIVDLIILTDDCKYEARVLFCGLVRDESHLSQI